MQPGHDRTINTNPLHQTIRQHDVSMGTATANHLDRPGLESPRSVSSIQIQISHTMLRNAHTACETFITESNAVGIHMLRQPCVNSGRLSTYCLYLVTRIPSGARL